MSAPIRFASLCFMVIVLLATLIGTIEYVRSTDEGKELIRWAAKQNSLKSARLEGGITLGSTDDWLLFAAKPSGYRLQRFSEEPPVELMVRAFPISALEDQDLSWRKLGAKLSGSFVSELHSYTTRSQKAPKVGLENYDEFLFHAFEIRQIGSQQWGDYQLQRSVEDKKPEIWRNLFTKRNGYLLHLHFRAPAAVSQSLTQDSIESLVDLIIPHSRDPYRRPSTEGY